MKKVNEYFLYFFWYIFYAILALSQQESNYTCDTTGNPKVKNLDLNINLKVRKDTNDWSLHVFNVVIQCNHIITIYNLLQKNSLAFSYFETIMYFWEAYGIMLISKVKNKHMFFPRFSQIKSSKVRHGLVFAFESSTFAHLDTKIFAHYFFCKLSHAQAEWMDTVVPCCSHC